MYHPTGGQTYTLAASISSTATSITLTSFTEPGSGTPYTMAIIGSDIVYATIEPKTTKSEFISFTGITQNDDGTATLTGVTRGLGRSYPYTAGDDYKFTHAGQTIFILSNSPEHYAQYAALDNDNVFTGQSSVPAPVGDQDIANKEYVDNLVNGGSVNVNRVIVAGTAGETLAAGNSVYFKVSDGRWWKTDADTSTTVYNVQLGIAQGAGTAGDNISGGVLLIGYDTNQSGGSVGSLAYVSNTAGALSTTTGTNTKVVGNYLTSSILYFNPMYYLNSLVGTPNVQVFTSSGTYTPTTGVRFIVVEVQAAGGNGSAGAAHSGGNTGRGAYSGGYGKKLISTIVSPTTVTIGAVGSNTSFGSTVVCTSGSSSAGGTSTGGDINITGGPGQPGTIIQAGGDNVNGGNGSDSILGFGGTGGRYDSGSGGNGVGYGSGGGSGGYQASGPTSRSGGNGAPGIVIVTEFF